MKKATSNQIVAVAKMHDAIGFNGVCLYGVTNGEQKNYAVGCWRDSLHNLQKEGILKYNGDFTYSVTQAR